MRTAELIGIEEEELYAFIDVLPTLWDRKKGILDSSMRPSLRKHHDCESSVFAVYLYNLLNSVVVLLVTYERESAVAIIEVSVLSDGATLTSYEERIRDILVDVTERDLMELTSEKTIPKGLFICPYCRAQYMRRVLKKNKDGDYECQNCGRGIDPSIV